MLTIMTRAVLIVSLVLYSMNSEAIIIRHDINQSKYIVNKTDYKWLATLQPIGMHGLLIDSNWVITAAHTVTCINEGSLIKLNDRFITVKSTYFYSKNALEIDHDIALIELDESVTDIEPIALYSGSDELNQSVFLMGTGDTGNGITGDNHENASRERVLIKAQNKIEKSESQIIQIRFDGTESALPLEGISASWDSGGPAFIENKNGSYLLGISSHSQGPEELSGKYGIDDVYMRVSYFKGWIDNMINSTDDYRNKNAYKIPSLKVGSDLYTACKLEAFKG